MALFFDRDWFDARIGELGLNLETVGKVLGLTEPELADVWKDQRELSARDVALLSALLGVPAAEIAAHAGVSTPVPGQAITLSDIEERLSRLEQKLAELSDLVRNFK